MLLLTAAIYHRTSIISVEFNDYRQDKSKKTSKIKYFMKKGWYFKRLQLIVVI